MLPSRRYSIVSLKADVAPCQQLYRLLAHLHATHTQKRFRGPLAVC